MLLLIWKDSFEFPGFDSVYLTGVHQCGIVDFDGHRLVMDLT